MHDCMIAWLHGGLALRAYKTVARGHTSLSILKSVTTQPFIHDDLNPCTPFTIHLCIHAILYIHAVMHAFFFFEIRVNLCNLWTLFSFLSGRG